jgi:hypothetical protein
MKDKRNDMYEKGFNTGFYLDFYAPNILAQVLKGLNGSKDEFFSGMRDGQAQNRLEMAQQKEKDIKADKEKEDMHRRTDEREREAAYRDKIKLESEAKEGSMDEQNPAEKTRMDELKEVRDRDTGAEKDRGGR